MNILYETSRQLESNWFKIWGNIWVESFFLKYFFVTSLVENRVPSRREHLRITSQKYFVDQYLITEGSIEHELIFNIRNGLFISLSACGTGLCCTFPASLSWVHLDVSIFTAPTTSLIWWLVFFHLLLYAARKRGVWPTSGRSPLDSSRPLFCFTREDAPLKRSRPRRLSSCRTRGTRTVSWSIGRKVDRRPQRPTSPSWTAKLPKSTHQQAHSVSTYACVAPGYSLSSRTVDARRWMPYLRKSTHPPRSLCWSAESVKVPLRYSPKMHEQSPSASLVTA